MSVWTTVGSVHFDAEALGELAHRCNPDRCPAGSPCCGHYEIAFEPEQIERLTGMLAEAARFAPHLRSHGDLQHPFDRTDDGLFAMDTDEDGLCVAAYHDERGAVRCSLHSAALDMNLPPEQCKPQCCWLWPVSVARSPEGTYVSVSSDVYAFTCNRRRRGRRPALHPDVAEILRGAFGEQAVTGVNKALADMPDPRLR